MCRSLSIEEVIWVSRRSVSLALSVLSAIGLFAGGASASGEPFAGTYRGFDMSFAVRGADGALYDFDVVATQQVASTPSEQALYLDLRRCSSFSRCRTVEHARKVLDEGAVSVSPDLTSASLSTTIGGVAVRLTAQASYLDPTTLTVTNPGFSVDSLDATGTGPNVSTTAYMASTGRAQIGHFVTCGNLAADIFSYQAVDRGGDPSRTPHRASAALPRGLLHGTHRTGCA